VQGKNHNPHGSSQGIPNRRVGPSDERLLGLLVHPMRGDELARQLNLSRQRIHQLVVKLLALGRIRVGDPDRVTFIIARQDDSSLLLSSSEERVLSSLSQTDVTPASYVATDLRMPLRRVLDRLSRLVDHGLVREAGRSWAGAQYSLTEAGATHPQCRPDATKARPAPLPVRSDRVREVLSHLADHGPARIRDLRDQLHISHSSINGLVQYLKRKGLIQKIADHHEAPFELTTTGWETHGAMTRRRVKERA